MYRRAIQGLRGWEAHRRAGLTLVPDHPPIRQGETVVLAVALPGISVIAACRIVYVVDEAGRFGFAYATLPAHPEQGEESFLVQRDEEGPSALSSRPSRGHATPLARLGSPIARQIQLSVTRRYLKGLAEFTAP